MTEPHITVTEAPPFPASPKDLRAAIFAKLGEDRVENDDLVILGSMLSEEPKINVITLSSILEPEQTTLAIASLVTQGCHVALPVIFSDRTDEDGLPWKDTSEVIEGLFRSIGILVMDRILIRGDRFWSYPCTDVSCCPPEGTLIES